MTHDGRIIGRNINTISHHIERPPIVSLEPIPEIEKELSIIDDALGKVIATNTNAPFAYYDVIELQDKIERKLEW